MHSNPNLGTRFPEKGTRACESEAAPIKRSTAFAATRTGRRGVTAANDAAAAPPMGGQRHAGTHN